MKIGAMLGDIFGSLFKKPVTEMYPFVKTAGPNRLRGQLHVRPGEMYRLPVVHERLPGQCH